MTTVTVLKAMPEARARELQVWRDSLDYNFVSDGELLIVGSKCSRGVWDDECGCTRGMSGTKSMSACSVFYVAQMTEEQLMNTYAQSEYAQHWGLTYEDYKIMVVHDEIKYAPNRLSVVQVAGGEGYNVTWKVQRFGKSVSIHE